MDRALENVEVCFADNVMIKVFSDVIINYLSTRPLSILAEAQFMIAGIDSKKSTHAFTWSALLHGR